MSSVMSLIDWELNRVNSKWVGSKQAEQTGGRWMVEEDLSGANRLGEVGETHAVRLLRDVFALYDNSSGEAIRWKRESGGQNLKLGTEASVQFIWAEVRRGQNQAELKPKGSNSSAGLTGWPSQRQRGSGRAEDVMIGNPGPFLLEPSPSQQAPQRRQDPRQSGQGEELVPRGQGALMDRLHFGHTENGLVADGTQKAQSRGCRMNDLFWGWPLTPPVKGGPGPQKWLKQGADRHSTDIKTKTKI